uniref:Phosphate transporter n=1 Tax=Globodera pallida TaxID=36090 RepID=A0A183CCF6_GLOPA
MDTGTASADGASLLSFHATHLWALIVAFHLSFIFAFVMGANEVSNAFATSVCSGAIKLRVAYVLATVVESAGAILLGYKVLETLRFKVIDLDMYVNTPNELLLGQVAILAGAALWMIFATSFRLPVSSTHSHIGGIIGFSLVMRGTAGLHMHNVINIVISWIVSPILSGIISAVLYVLFDIAVLRRRDPVKSAFISMPIFYFAVISFITFMVIFRGSKWIGFDKTTFWPALLVSVAVGAVSALIFQFVVRRFLLKWLKNASARSSNSVNNNNIDELHAAAGGTSSVRPRLSSQENRNVEEPPPPSPPAHSIKQTKIDFNPPGLLKRILPDPKRTNNPQTLRLFSAVQVFTGCFTGFSHGSKDIPNTIAPLATLLFVYNNVHVPKPQETPLWILFYGSMGTCVGFWMLGHRVIRTVGQELTEINPFCGFCVELGAAITVVIASKIGIPISMTLCIVGSVVSVGAVRGSVPVNWPLFRNVFIAWVVTFPLTAVFSAAAMFLLKTFFL